MVNRILKLIARFILALFIVTMIASCKKGHGVTNSDSVIGSWELWRVKGDEPTTTLPAGNGNILMLTSTTYAYYVNGQLTNSGMYELKDDAGAQSNICQIFPAGTFTRRIIYDGNTTVQKSFIDVSNDQLSLASGCFASDGGSIRIYKRVNTSDTIGGL